MKDYLALEEEQLKDLHWHIIRLAMASVANYCIIPMQDYLGLGEEARINTPGTQGINWKWRMEKDAFTEELVKKIKRLTEVYGR